MCMCVWVCVCGGWGGDSRSTQVREEGEEGERAVGSGLKSERAEASDGEADEEADDGLSPGRKKRKAARADRREYKKQKRIIVDYYKSTYEIDVYT